jgi:hypothetical protein
LELADGVVSARVFLDDCPVSVAARMLAVLDAMATAPPPAFSGGGFWEAMHAPMTGYQEVRVQGQARGTARMNFRLFYYLDRQGPGLPREAIVLLDGRAKPLRTALSESDNADVRQLGTDYRSSNPRRIAIRYLPGEPVPEPAEYLCDGAAAACPHTRRLEAGGVFAAMAENCPGAQWRPRYVRQVGERHLTLSEEEPQTSRETGRGARDDSPLQTQNERHAALCDA